MLNLDQLYEFCTVVHFRNITKAAEYLFVSQPSLSRHLSELENSLGTKLIERGNSKTFTLTPAGELLNEEGKQILDSISLMEDHVKRLSTGRSGSLRIHSRPYMNAAWNELIYQFRQDHPDIDFQYFQHPPEPLINGILSGHSDFTVAYDYEIWQHGEQINGICLWEEDFVATVSPYHPLAAQSSVTVEQLKQETLVLGQTPEVGVYDKGRLYDVLSLFTDNSYAALNNTSIVLQVSGGKGFSIYPYSIAASFPMLKVLPISDLDCKIKCFLVSSRENSNPAVCIFRDYVMQNFK